MKTNNSQTGFIRIIGGKWRGRKLSFSPSANLRPTKDRVRETVFNWLAKNIVGARCLDCFAGTGAFGFEALSRGAAYVTMIDKSPQIIKQLTANAKLLNAQNFDCYCAAMPHLNQPLTQFDIVFLDPPYHQNLIAPCCELLINTHLLKDNALVYIEAETELSPLPTPLNWQIVKQGKAGPVAYFLIATQYSNSG